MRAAVSFALITAGALSVGACAQLLGDFDDDGAGGGAGGASSSSSTSTSSSSTSTSSSTSSSGGTCKGGAASCTSAADCPALPGDCSEASCKAGCCFPVAIAAGKPAAKQKAGDCATKVCNAAGQATSMVDDTDTPAPMDPCHKGACTAGKGGQIVNTTVLPCSLGMKQGVCADPMGPLAGTCIGCNATPDCTMPLVCDTMHNCVPTSCADGLKNGTETGTDCGGGVCSGCALGDPCLSAADCGSSTCLNNVCVCAMGLSPCSGTCSNPSNDPANCGMCGIACTASEVCAGGMCGCTAPATDCAGTCTDRTTDPANCGMCGTACTIAGQSCVASACACDASSTLCPVDGCVDLTVSPTNCGACGTVCGSGASCVASVCTCPPGQILCGAAPGVCVDPTQDSANCGMCDLACAAPMTCVASVCM